jgi:predicted amidophosphoribosyltransferase
LREAMAGSKADLLQVLRGDLDLGTCCQCGRSSAPNLRYHCQECAEAIYASRRLCDVCGLPTENRHSVKCPSCFQRWRWPVMPSWMEEHRN